MQSAKRQAGAIKLVRDNLSDDVAVTLRNMIVDGSLPAGDRINEVHLSQQLGVSRTPLREALSKLAHEGALRSLPRIGYFVRPLSLEEFEEVYAIRPLLDPEALRLSGLPSRERLDRLKALNDRLEKAKNADAIIALDDEWHLELIADCPNSVLVDLIRQFIQRTRRYEIGLMRERRNVSVAIENHKAVMSALRRRDLDAACNALRRNLQHGREPIVAWLKSRTSEIQSG
jgi:DNA-binding GntR family transcriptional regulator